MKKTLTILSILVTTSAFAQLRPTTSEPTDPSNKYMLMQSALSLENSGKNRQLSLLFTSVSVVSSFAGSNLYASALSNNTSTSSAQLLFVLAGASAVTSLGLRIVSNKQLRKSGAYLNAYANGVVITF